MPLTPPVPIGFVMSSFEPGGTERQMIELVRRLDRARWEVHVACLRPGGRWRERVESVAPVTYFPVDSFKSAALPREARRFARWCRERQLAVVHTVDLPTNIFGQLPAAATRVPLRVANRRDVNPGRSALELVLQRAAYACAHLVVANARAAAERLRRERVPARKIALIPNGLDLSAAERTGRRAALRRVIVVANLRPEKGHDVLVDAAPAVLREFPDARFELVGGGAERDALAARAEARGVGGAFVFAGHADNVAERLAAADLFVLPSRSEAFPNALLEAMAGGLPAVASAVGGVLELVEHERTGLLVPPSDAAALAAALTRLMRRPEEAARMGEAARAHVEAHYTFDRMVASFDAMYLDRLKRRGVPIETRPSLPFRKSA